MGSTAGVIIADVVLGLKWKPLRILDDYSLKLIRARERRITYVYEIVKMLAPQEPSSDFPRGEFEEYDLGQNGSEQGPLLAIAHIFRAKGL